MPLKSYHVYIMTNPSKTLYVGVTNNLELRVRQHKLKQIPGFTARYNITQLVYYEETSDVLVAIAREKNDQRLAAGQEDRADRMRQSELARP